MALDIIVNEFRGLCSPGGFRHGIASTRKHSEVQQFPRSPPRTRLLRARDRPFRQPRSSLDAGENKPRDYLPSNSGQPQAETNEGLSSSKDKQPTGASNARARALACKKAKETAGSTKKDKQQKSSAPERPGNVPEVEIVTGKTFQSRMTVVTDESSSIPNLALSSSLNGLEETIQGEGAPENAPKVEIMTGKSFESQLAQSTVESSSVSKSSPSSSFQDTAQGGSSPDKEVRSPGKVSGFEPAAQEQQKESSPSLDAFTRAKAYKQQQLEMVEALKQKSSDTGTPASSSSVSTPSALAENLVEVEIVTREGVIKKLVNPEKAFSNVKEIRRTGISNLDFSGLGFADKKERGGKVIQDSYQPPPPGVLPEVEIITRDAETAEAGITEVESDMYKPKVSSWGVFPRPANISKTFGGGRTIRPGEPLETESEREAREAKTRKQLAEYKKKLGLDVNPRVKAECDKLLKEGNTLMESGDLKGAIDYFEQVMEKMVFQSELHGLAALQGALCLDSLARYAQAREVYEKLISHPNAKIRKRARQLLYGFQAMEDLKMSPSNKWDTSVYAKYFEAFSDGYNNTYKAREEEISENLGQQIAVYSLLLVLPIFLVVALAFSKSSVS